MLKDIAVSYKVVYDTSEEIQRICENAIVVLDEKDHNKKTEFQLELEYNTTQVHTDAKACVLQMQNAGYVLTEETNDTYVLYRYEKEREGDIKITITKYENRIGVFIEPLVTFEYHYQS